MILGAFVTVFPVVGIRQSWSCVLDDTAQLVFYAAWFPTVALTGAILFTKSAKGDPVLTWAKGNQRRQLILKIVLPAAATLFFLLYFSVNALCQRLHIFIVHGNASHLELYRYSGLVVCLAGLILQVYSLTLERHNLKLVKNPCFLATLTVLVGIPPLFGTWLPLVSIPGILAAMKWIISAQEQCLIERPGCYDQPKDSLKWRVLPFIY